MRNEVNAVLGAKHRAGSAADGAVVLGQGIECA